jgi:hypothetical protein
MRTTIGMLGLAAALLAPCAANAQAASAGKPELVEQPGLLALVQPRIAELREAGISQIVGRTGARNNIQVLTRFGPAYMRWPRGTTPVAFELYFNDNATNAAFAADFADKARWTATMNAVLPAALKQAAQARASASKPKAG